MRAAYRPGASARTVSFVGELFSKRDVQPPATCCQSLGSAAIPAASGKALFWSILYRRVVSVLCVQGLTHSLSLLYTLSGTRIRTRWRSSRLIAAHCLKLKFALLIPQEQQLLLDAQMSVAIDKGICVVCFRLMTTTQTCSLEVFWAMFFYIFLVVYKMVILKETQTKMVSNRF